MIYYDLETGGTDPLIHPIIQIGAVAYLNNFAVDDFEVKLTFDRELCDEEALRLNGYSDDRWIRAVEPKHALNRFAEFCKGYATIECISKKTGNPYGVAQGAAYNATFDSAFLQDAFKRNGIFLPMYPRSLCVLQQCEWWLQMFPPAEKLENHKLATLCKYTGVKLDNAHDALADVRATAQLSQKIIKTTQKYMLAGKLHEANNGDCIRDPDERR